MTDFTQMTNIGLLVFWTCFLAFCHLGICQEDADPSLEMFRLSIRDRYGDKVEVPYQGGSLVLPCLLMRVFNKPCQEPFGEMSLMRTDKNGQHTTVRSEPGTCDNPIVTFTLPVEAEFGTYWCKRKNERINENALFRHHYYLCNNKDCTSATCPNNYAVCVTTEGKSQQHCSKPELSSCRYRNVAPGQDHKRIYPSITENLCTAMATDVYEEAWGEWDGPIVDANLNAPKHSWPRLSYDDRTIVMMEQILVRESLANLVLAYQNKWELQHKHLRCRFKTISKDVIDVFNDASLQTSKTISLKLNETIFRNGSKTYKVQCIFHDPEMQSEELDIASNIQLDAILVNIGGQLEITGQQKQQDAFVNKMSCRLTPEPTDEFSAPLYFWTKHRGDGAPILGNHLTLNADAESGEYRCHANVTYSSCSPPRRFERTIDSEVIRAVFRATTTTTTTKATTTSSTTTTTTSSSSSASSAKIIPTTVGIIFSTPGTLPHPSGPSGPSGPKITTVTGPSSSPTRTEGSAQPSGPKITTATGPSSSLTGIAEGTPIGQGHDGASTMPIWNCHFVMLLVIAFGLVIDNAM